jgi:hypothetical protein
MATVLVTFVLLNIASTMCIHSGTSSSRLGSLNRDMANLNRRVYSLSNIYMSSSDDYSFKNVKKLLATTLLAPVLLTSGFGPAMGTMSVRADDELAKFAAEGNAVGVDGTCFMKKCALETSSCANDPTCLKGLSCLARCKGGSMCSTGCFAKYGSDNLDNLLACTVEKNDCVHVPREANAGWKTDTLADLPTAPLQAFKPESLDGTWYKVMGLDSRYDCFDCQRNTFKLEPDRTPRIDQVTGDDDANTKRQQQKIRLSMEALFRIPRPTAPGYLQNRINEHLRLGEPGEMATLQSEGQMFGLTFWENWYVIGDTHQPSGPMESIKFGVPVVFAATNQVPDMKLIYYTGHTLQGSYKGAFLYSRSPKMDLESILQAKELILKSGLNPQDFCMIRNQCFLNEKGKMPIKETFDILEAKARKQETPLWFLGQGFFRTTRQVAQELADWFEDPAYLSDWLLDQQEHMILDQPLAVSPFASLPEDE